MCISPHSIKVYNKYKRGHDIVPVPCNHCYECVRKRKLDWEIRLSVESSVSSHVFFGMLTYNDECYHSDIQVKEIQYYIKRLRYNLDKFYPGCKLKYFCVSEFGELKDRLHYHILYLLDNNFTDTFREFEELCKMSWVTKKPLSQEQKDWRKLVFKQFKRTCKDTKSDRYIYMRKWSRRKYDDISLGFATAQKLKGGTAIGSIHYACKYIQKQYNKRFSSHLGYDAWRRYMVDSGQLSLNANLDESKIEPLCCKYLYTPSFTDYPTFPVRGRNYPIPRRWLLNTIGKGYTSFLVGKLVNELILTEKYINLDKISYHWHKEPERLDFVLSKEKQTLIDRANNYKERLLFYDAFPENELLKEWQTIMIPRRMPNCLVERNSIDLIETPLPLKWDS